jgi:hypothetical protein
LPKGSVFINKIIDTCQDINLRIMKRNGLGVTSAPSCQTFVVLSIVPIATFHIARIDGLSSFLTPDDLDDFVFSAPYDLLLNCNQMTLLVVFDHLRIFQMLIDNLDRLLRTSTPRVRDRLFTTLGRFSHILIRLPAITEKQRRFTIALFFDRLDQLFCFFLGPFPMMYGMHKPTARQHIDTRPALTHIGSCSFVFAEPSFFFGYTTNIHQCDTGSNAELSHDTP